MTSVKNENYTHLARNLRSHMERRGLNPRQLSLAAGLNVTAVRDILERGLRCPRYDTLRALANSLNVTVDSLMNPGGEEKFRQIENKERPHNQEAMLTGREREVLHWVAFGKTDDEIGLILSLSRSTVKAHLKNVYSRFQVHNRTYAVIKALMSGAFHLDAQ